ncbi:putative leucine-rich repeat receptor-like serine/threonine-protein kinase At2g24130 isoform X1 [Zingiber officinale]|uniref:non-specific serine/threonine protein kinase n=1 Tax=Zingiber officinale TaxID=94328 RepID=A0A8J5GIU8_ZINOF|nr:putative leucine-rich repeat receptor-like serine/threonine-protein kinase At2g24130 isoform X1 [Zingiber officinale]KAG6502363.1 hypothetical protein ZIOFF_042255 [Zingiber officinale]
MDCHMIVLVKFALLLFIPSVLPLHQSGTIWTDQSALLEFKKGIISDPENALSNWSRQNHVCEWNGIICSLSPQRVNRVTLKGKSLVGTLSPSLSNLSQLILLELSVNTLRGSIPVEFGSLSQLQALALKQNDLQGSIPESLGMLANLEFIDFSYNKLHGQLPVSLLYNCTKLSYVDFSTNLFTGFIPSKLGYHLPWLTNLLLYSNQLVGGIPAYLTNSTMLEEIDIENNSFGGILPSYILMQLSSLKLLHLSYNNFSSDDRNSNLVPFFDAISNLTHLEELELASNHLGGELPATIGLLGVNLSEIDLGHNQIQGTIPANLTKLVTLEWLDLSNNLLHGSIPSEILLMPKLLRLWLSNNSLSGEIPSPALSQIGLLDLSKNKLNGTIPAAFADLTQLRQLKLSENQLTGTIPPSLGDTKLELLDLSYNRLTGVIPAQVASLSSLLVYFNLSHNLLQGRLPAELRQMNKVGAIDLSSNNFSGEIPQSLGGCVVIELLDLSHNSLQGSIPQSIGSLLSIKTLDLSFNQLSGPIPDSLRRCSSLRLLDISFNNFSGPLPEGGIFNLLTSDRIRGNRFCGSLPGNGIPSCRHKRGLMHSRLGLILLVSIVTVVAFMATVICGTVYMIMRKRSRRRREGDDPSKNLFLSITSGFPRITYRELVEATGGFEESRLVGSGGFGQVYRGVLRDGTAVAVKVLQLQSGNSTRSFKRECQVLKNIRHRNLMRIITACSLPDFKALVLPFMANGSLESHLYPKGEPSSRLSLQERVNICSDVAEGLAYLHHHSPAKVVHCDLKPSNILLNDDMTALVSDFGIARLVMTAEEGSAEAATATANSTANFLHGSIGYVAPEYGYGRSASTKGDVYSFGILVLEMVTGKRPTDDMFGEGVSLQRWARRGCRSKLETVVDATLMREVSDRSQEVKKMWEIAIAELLELGLVCSNESPADRPTMLDAADDLDRLKQYLAGDATATFTSSIGMSSASVGAASSDYG